MGKLASLKRALDMSKAARMKRAAEQGFDTSKTFYHGTSGNEGIEFFERSRMGTGTDDGFLGRGVYTSESPDVASSYAWFGRGQGAVYPLNTRGNYLKIKELPDDVGDMFAREKRVREALGLTKDADAWDVTDAARAKGYDGVEFEFLDSSETPGGLLERVTFDPENIRSVNAAFDPENVGKPDLLGQATPGGMAAAGGLAAAEFMRRRANKTQTLKGLGEAALTVGSGLVGGVIGDLSRLGGYLNPFMSVEDTERGAEALSGRVTYQPSQEAIPYLEPISQGLETFEQDINRGIPEGLREQWGRIHPRLRGIAETTLF